MSRWMQVVPSLWTVHGVRRKFGILAALAAGLGSQAVSLAGDGAQALVLSGKELNEENIVNGLVLPDTVVRDLKARPSVSMLITFKTNSADLTAASMEQLAVAAGAFKNERLIKYTFVIEGHADPRGNSATNLALSQRRAEGVRNYLMATHGIEPRRLVPKGKGDQEVINRAHPAAPENRRVTFVTQWQ